MKEKLYQDRFISWKKSLILAIIGILIASIGFFIPVGETSATMNIGNSSRPVHFVVVIGFLLTFPWLIYSYFLSIVHWKERYKGTSSDSWVVFFMLTSNNFFGLLLIILYFIKNIFPDMKGTGLYKREKVINKS